MKPICTLILGYLLIPVFSKAQLGSSCSTPYTIILDGVQRSYNTSSNTSTAAYCPISGSSPITFFSFTTNAAAEMPLLDIDAPGGTDCEIALYLGNCTNGNLVTGSSMCFYDAQGLWAPDPGYALLPNTSYNLRIKTAAGGNILIAGQSYTPTNTTCAGATTIGPTLTNDNNACHHPGPGITPGQLCASTLENTAFYTYTVESTGMTALSIENASCDNGAGTNTIGFQVGFFTGSCSSLWYLGCYAGFGTNIQANTGILVAGTQIFVAVDGIGGSNCQYSVRAINSVLLSAKLKYFSAFKQADGNKLKWTTLQEINNESFEIQRSFDGVNFRKLGMMSGQINSNSEKNYEFNDKGAPRICYYRLKYISTSGKSSYSNIVKVDRGNMSPFNISLNNPVSGQLNMTITSPINKSANLFIRNINGQLIYQDKINCVKGSNTVTKDISFLNTGTYTITATLDQWNESRSFMKVQ